MPGASSRHTELKRAMGWPAGLRTGPLDKASVPSVSTSTWSGCHENGAAGTSKKCLQPSATAALPFNTFAPLKNTACADRWRKKAEKSRSAMLRANARSAANTSRFAASRSGWAIAAWLANTPAHARANATDRVIASTSARRTRLCACRDELTSGQAGEGPAVPSEGARPARLECTTSAATVTALTSTLTEPPPHAWLIAPSACDWRSKSERQADLPRLEPHVF